MNTETNIPNQTVTPVENQNSPAPEVDNSEEAKLKREAEVGEHDIVIEEDFPINIEISEVSSFDMGATPTEEDTQEPEIGTEQTGNITF